MKAVLTLTLAMVLIITVASCGSKSKTPTPEESGYEAIYTPPWWDADSCLNDEEYLCQRATMESKDMQVAVNKATAQARAELQAQVEAKLELSAKVFADETGYGEDAEFIATYTQTIKEIASGILQASVPYRDEVRKEKETELYRAWVLMRLVINDAYLANYHAMKANNNIYTRFRSSEAFKEHEKEMEKYEQYKKDQGY